MGSSEVGPCGEVHAVVWQYIDHEIDGMSCAQLEAHLAECPPCLRAVEFDRRFKEVVRRCADPGPVPEERVSDLVARIKQRLAANPQPPPPEWGSEA